IEALGGQALPVVTDVGRAEDVRRLVETTVERFGGLDILVNNAGIGMRVPIDEVDLEEYDQLMDTNLKGMYLGCHFAVPHMKTAGRGAIINISSVHGLDGCPHNTVYAASKAGQAGGTRALAAELAPFDIRVNAISPGAIWIERSQERWLQRVRDEHRDEFLERFGDRLRERGRHYQPLRRNGEVEDIAYCAVYLASDEARFVTGQNIAVDGGLTTTLGVPRDRDETESVRERLREMRDWVDAHQVDDAPEWPPFLRG
ncbi:SDR family NAD(P)-dependent oxidoreductase, partial [Candidatus Latescibacterota bacterium]